MLMMTNSSLKIKNSQANIYIYIYGFLNISHLSEQYNKELHLKLTQGG